jgi:3-methyladenine DNA glycosylase Tag
MRTFDEIFAIAADRKGGPQALEAMLGKPVPPAELAQIPEDRWLAQMTKCILQSGFNWKVIEAKWDGFEHRFRGFDVDACAFMPPDDFDDAVADKGIVRNPVKIRAIQENAQFLQDLRAEGGVGVVLGGWPSERYNELLEMLGKRGSRLGGSTAQYTMRFMGRDSYILSRDVTARLIAEGVIDKAPSGKGAMRAVQEAFNTWSAQSGRSLTEISRVLAMSL